MIKDKFISVVIPVLDEEGSIRLLYSELAGVLATYNKWEILFIDDGSRDASVEIITEIIQQDENVRLIKFYKNYGKADALEEGFQSVRGNLVVTLDADLQDDPKEIPRMIAKLDEGWDLVSGWKKTRHDPASKRWPSKVFNFVTRMLTGVHIHDFNCGFKVYRSEVVKSIELYGGLHRYIPALAKTKGFRVTELAVNHRPREFGQTKYGGARYFHGFFDLLTVLFIGKYISRPLHFFGLIGMILFSMGLGINIYLSFGWFMGVWIGNRPIFFLGILLVIIGIQFFSIGLLGEIMVKLTRKNENRVQSIITNKS